MKKIRTLTILFVALGLMVCSAGISLAKKTVGTAFTYSGKLAKGGGLVDDPCDFLCTLWNDPCGVDEVNQVGDTLVFNELEVKNGKFRLSLDFGSDPNVFNGEVRWLEIGVRAGYLDDPYEYTILKPRVELTPAPYAVNAGRISGEKVVKSEHLGDKAVDPNKIADKAVRREHIGDKAVDPNKIADKAVRREHIENRAVDPNKIAKKAVRAEHLEEKIVDANKLGDISGYYLETSYIGNMIYLRNLAGGSAAIIKLEHFGEGAALEAYVANGAGTGVYGHSAGMGGIGVKGESTSGSNTDTGVYGHSTGGGIGVKGESDTGYAGCFEGQTAVNGTFYVGNSTLGPAQEKLHVDGKVYIAEMEAAGSGGYAVKWEDNRLKRQTSSAQYKDNIQPMQDNVNKILQAEAKSFKWKNSGQNGIGFIAEEFDALGLKNLVIYKDGRPDGVQYELVPVYLLEVLKKQVQTTEQLRQDNELLKQRIEALERSTQSNQLLNLKGVGR